MYPENRQSALLVQLETERAVAELLEEALSLWLPLARGTVLAAAEPPPNPGAAADKSAQWDYLVDALILYGIGVVAADAFDTAYTVMTGAPMAVGQAIRPLVGFDMPGMPSRSDLRSRAGAVLRRRLGIDVDRVDDLYSRVSDVRQFVDRHMSDVRGRVMDVVGRVFTRTRNAIEDSPETSRVDVRPVFDPLDPEWTAVVDQVAQTQATGLLNAATTTAARNAETDLGRGMQVEWVAILDSHTREAHAAATGQRRPIGSGFSVGGESLRFPGDPLGSPENTINCRCRLFAFFTDPHPDLTAAADSSRDDESDATGFMRRVHDMTVSDIHDTLTELQLESELQSEFKNWVEECGGLPKYVKRITKHLQEKGMTESRAIATAVNAAKKMCSTGDVNFPGRQNVNPGSKAEACTAVAEWEKLKACAARKNAESAASLARAVAWAESQSGEPYVSGGDGIASVSEKVAPMPEYRSFTSTLAVIGTPTDDGRVFAPDITLSFRDFPLPLLWQKQSAGGHVDAFTVGVIESAGVVGTEVIGKGYMLDTPEAHEAAMQIAHGVTGPSVDLGDVEWELRTPAGLVVSEDEWRNDPDMQVLQAVTSAKMLAATLVATPAFGQTSVRLGEMVTKNDEALVAAAGMLKPGLIDVPLYDPELFANPEFGEPTPPQMTENGRIQGHLAVFDVCHIGIQDSCVIAPRSQTDYAWFHTAPPVKTTQGKVKVGRLTVGTGHAGPRMGPIPAMAHYDDTGTCFAIVHVGEDEHGIWFSGIPAPGATEEQIAVGLAAPLSGDWRSVGGNYELVAALAVNTPGFPVIASGATDEHDEPLALVASLGPCTEMAMSGASGLPIADRGVEWNGAAAAGRVFDSCSDADGNIDVACASRAFLWRDGDGKNRGDYKLGFADVIDGKLQIVPKGVAACAGGRGVNAASIPPGDKATIENKICALYGKIRSRFADWPECPFTPAKASVHASELELARNIVSEWRFAEKREAMAKELVSAEVRRQTAALMQKAGQ